MLWVLDNEEEPTLILKRFNWTAWIVEPGYPPTHESYQTEELLTIEEIAEIFINLGMPETSRARTCTHNTRIRTHTHTRTHACTRSPRTLALRVALTDSLPLLPLVVERLLWQSACSAREPDRFAANGFLALIYLKSNLSELYV